MNSRKVPLSFAERTSLRIIFYSLGSFSALAFPYSIKGAETSKTSRAVEAIEDLLKEPAPLPDWKAYLKRTRAMPHGPPPAADAPLEQILAYWHRPPKDSAPDAATQSRLLKICEDNPDEFFRLLALFSEESTEVYDRIKETAERLQSAKSAKNESTIDLLQNWLANHRRHGSIDLAAQVFHASKPAMHNRDEAAAELIRNNRKASMELFLKKSRDSDVLNQTQAICALLHDFRDELTLRQRTDFKRKLRRIGSDKKAKRDARAKAIRQVMEIASAEDDRWFLDLFGDPTLKILPETPATPLALVVTEHAEYWVPKVIGLVKSNDATMRAAAVYCLTQFEGEKARTDATRALLPWLNDPTWAPDSEQLRGRAKLIENLSKLELSESVPGLLKVIEEATGHELSAAAFALEHQHAIVAIEPLKRAFARESDRQDREFIIWTLMDLGAFTRAEKVEAIKVYAKRISTPEGSAEIKEATGVFPSSRLDLTTTLGQQLAGMHRRGDDEIVADVVNFAKQAEITDQETADALKTILAGWHAPPVTGFFIDQLRSGNLAASWLKEMIRDSTVSDTLSQVDDLTGVGRGIQAALTEDARLIAEILDGKDDREKAALLAVARLQATPLPIGRIISLLDSGDKQLAHAADRYLEASDDAVAREALWQRANGQARILGPKRSFGEEDYTVDWVAPKESDLRDLVLKEDGPQEIFAYVGPGNSRLSVLSLLVYHDRTLLRCDEYNGRTRERSVQPDELRVFLEWLNRERIEDLPSFDLGAIGDLQQAEFLHVSRARGRRVSMIDPPDYRDHAFRSNWRDEMLDVDVTIYAELIHRMLQLNNAPSAVFYRTLESLPGFQIVQRYEEREVSSLRVKDGQPFAVIYPTPGKSEWHRLTESGISTDVVAEPPQNYFPGRQPTPAGFYSGWFVEAKAGPFAGKKIGSGTREEDQTEGLWLVPKQGPPELLTKGSYANPILTPDGNWIVASKFDSDNPHPWRTVRIEAASRREIAVPIPAPRLFNITVLSWLDELRRVLVCRTKADPDVSWYMRKAEFFLLNPATGEAEESSLDFRPFVDGDPSRLQPTGTTGEYWAVVGEQENTKPTTTLGRYNTVNFHFAPVLEFKGIDLTTDHIVVDEAHGIAWLNLNRDLIRLALPKDSAPSK